MDLIGYVTVQEADTYIASHYLSTDEVVSAWNALSESDKAVLLTKAFQIIELLPFTGRKTAPGQPYAFPRWPDKTVPDRIKWAQIELALNKSDASSNEDAKYYERLWLYGVDSYTIGNLSEKTSTGSYTIGGAQATGVTSAEAERLLQPYLGGGYRI